MRNSLLPLIVLLLVGASFAYDNWTMDGDSVYWTSNGYTIRAYPAISNEPINHYQYVNFTSTNPANIITNLSFVFNQQPLSGDVMLWQNLSHVVQVPHITRTSALYTVVGVISFVPSTSPCQLGDAQNIYNYNVTYNPGNGTTTGIACFNSYTNNGNDYTLNYSYNVTNYIPENQYWMDWGSILNSFTYTDISGYAVYTINNVPFNGSTNYQTKFMYTFPTVINVNGNGTTTHPYTGKFDIYAHGGSPSQVVAGTAPIYVQLDPWYNSTGGIVTYDGNFTVATFLANGTFNVTGTIPNMTVLVVGGGGGAGNNYGGGGGAGGLIYNTTTGTGAITVVVGAGGAGGAPGGDSPGMTGDNSSFGTLTAAGGGGGGQHNAGKDGGSGGGASYSSNGGAGTANQGNPGGNSSATLAGGGGGGAGAAGTSAVVTKGSGGVGLNYTINGTNIYYAAGGDGGDYTPIQNGIDGSNNTGNGGSGGSQARGGSGGSGIVIIRYPTYVAPVTGNYNITLISPTNSAVLNTTNVSHVFSVESYSNYTNGTTTYDGLYTILTFTTNGTFHAAGTINATILVAAGGGGGGSRYGGGGGAGGLIYSASYGMTGDINVIIGAGGNGGIDDHGDGNGDHMGFSGGNSSFGTLTAVGGGGGGQWDYCPASGGSGGGGSYNCIGASGIGGQGRSGGNGTGGIAGGGGGGAGTSGTNAIVNVNGSGGLGFNYSIGGTNIYYAAGGDGGQMSPPSGAGANGAANTGSGGAGGGGNYAAGTGGNGASGIVIVRYLTSDMNASTDMNLTLQLYVDGMLNYTTTNISSIYNITLPMLDGVHSWYVLAGNTSNMSDNATSPTWSYTVLAFNTTKSFTYTQNESDYFNYTHIATISTDYPASDMAVNATMELNGTVYIPSRVNNGTQIIFTTTPTTPIATATNRNHTAIWNFSITYLPFGTTDFANGSYNITVLAINYSKTASSQGNQSDLYLYPHTSVVNATSGVADVNATVTINGTSYAASKSVTYGANRIFTLTANILPPEQAIGNQTNYSAIWNYTLLFTNGSINNTIGGYNITVFRGGLSYCNGNFTAPSLNITARIEGTSTIITASHVLSSTYSGTTRARTSYLLGNGMSFALCIDPTGSNYTATNTLSSNSSGYSPRTNLFIMTFNSVVQNYSVSLLNTTIGSFYTFTVVDDYSNPIQSASITAYRFNPVTGLDELSGQVLTNPDGTGTFFLEPLVTYTINTSKSGYQSNQFSFIPSSTLTMKITLHSIGGGVVPTENITWTLLPLASWSNTSENIIFTIVAGNSNLAYFGMHIFNYSNNTNNTIYIQTLTTPAGGVINYTLVNNGTYYINVWYNTTNGTFYGPVVKIFTIGGGLTEQAKWTWIGGNIVSGWTYYLIALLAVCLTVSMFGGALGEGSAWAGLIVLWIFSIFNPNVIIIPLIDSAGIHMTTVMASMITTVIMISSWYGRQYP